jgi:hypothetical protein
MPSPKSAPAHLAPLGAPAAALSDVGPAASPNQIPPPHPGTSLVTEGAGTGTMEEGGSAQGPLVSETGLVIAQTSAVGALVGTGMDKGALPGIARVGGTEGLEDHTRDQVLRRGEDAEFAVEPEGAVHTELVPHVEQDAALHGRRRVKPETLAFRAAFREAAIAAAEAGQEEALEVDLGEGEQGTPQWLRLRETRLTASAFGNALGCTFSPSIYFVPPF